MNFLWDNIFRRQERQQDVKSILSNNFLFRNLTKRELSLVQTLVHIRRYRTGEPIFRQNETGVGMYIIGKGRVEISIFDDNPAEKQRDKELVVTTLEAGDFFGEISLVEETSIRSATARSAEDCVLVGFFKSDLMEILDRNPEAGIKIIFRLAEVLGRRLKETTDKISQLKKEIRMLGEMQEVSRDPRRFNPEKN